MIRTQIFLVGNKSCRLLVGTYVRHHATKEDGMRAARKDNLSKKRTAGDLMSRAVVTISPNDSIHSVAARLAENGISGAPVVDRGELVGIISEADLIREAFPPARIERPGSVTHSLRLLLRGRGALFVKDASVASVMTRNVVTVLPTTGLSEAAAKMDGMGLKRLPVVDDKGHLIGIVSR